MEMTLQQRLDRLLDAYSHHYDIFRDVTVEGGRFPAAAFFHLRDEQYLISKKNVLSVVEQHEYVYFFLTDHLDAPTLLAQLELSKQAGLANIKPSKEHMCSYVTLVVLANTIDPEAKRVLTHTRLRKNFLFAIHGWMEYRVAAMECNTNCFVSNRAGKETRKNLECNFKLRKEQEGRTTQ